MVRYEIEGGRPLNGELTVQGSKNAVLPMMAAALLCRGSVVLHNCPRIDDVFCMIRILEHLGCTVNWEGHTVIIDAYEVRSEIVPAKEAKRMRSSVILLGALLGRRKKSVLSRPGGCVIGERPIDLHLSSLQKMGADIRQEEEYMYGKASVLTGARIELAKSSVGATENILLMAHGLGLGGVWTALYPLKERYEGMQQLLHLPKTMIPLNALTIGYPKNQAEAKDKWKEENVSYNKWMEKNS